MSVNNPTILVIFGATGDLTHRKIIPSLYNLDKQGLLPHKFKIIAVGRREINTKEYILSLESFIKSNYKQTFNERSFKRFSGYVEYFKGDLEQSDSYERLITHIENVDKSFKFSSNKFFYLSISPDLYEKTFDYLCNSRIKKLSQNTHVLKIIVEKPFGKSLKDFKKLNGKLLNSFREDQIFRIDHLLGKETIQNILYLRAFNPLLFNPVNNANLESVKIEYFEKLGVEGRGGYYDSYGQLRDMVQSHMLQLFALVFMKLPEKFNSELISNNKSEVIKSLKVKDYKTDISRGQYKEGVIDGKVVTSYRKEEKIPDNSQTETFVKIKAKLNLDGYKNLPVTLVTGKRLPHKRVQIILDFNDAVIFGLRSTNQIVIQIQPEESVVLKLKIKNPSSNSLETVNMKFTYKEEFPFILPDAYEKILLDILNHTQELSVSTKELEESWNFIDKITASWDSNKNLKLYTAGSDELI